MPLPLSVAIACKNNEATIARTLESVGGAAGLASEIVAVDSGSTDGTIALLEKYGAKVIRSPWLGHVKTKQLAIDSCSQAWVMLLDSDESVQPELAGAIRAALERNESGVDGLEVNRCVWYAGKPLAHAWQPEWRLRIFRRATARCEGIDPHDTVRLTSNGRTQKLAGLLRHDSFVTFGEHLGKQLAYARLSAEGMHAAGQRGSYWKLATSPVAAFARQLLIKRAFLDGWPGWLAAGSTAAATLMKHMILIEKSRGTPE